MLTMDASIERLAAPHQVKISTRPFRAVTSPTSQTNIQVEKEDETIIPTSSELTSSDPKAPSVFFAGTRSPTVCLHFFIPQAETSSRTLAHPLWSRSLLRQALSRYLRRHQS